MSKFGTEIGNQLMKFTELIKLMRNHSSSELHKLYLSINLQPQSQFSFLFSVFDEITNLSAERLAGRFL